jgi:predicted ATP-dependent serine protease
MPTIKRCKECGHKFNAALSYCPDCETYSDQEKESEDINDYYNENFSPNQEYERSNKPYLDSN